MTPAPRFIAILHTHWDREWYQPLGAWLPKWSRAMDAILDLLESDERARAFHIDGQTILLDDYLTMRPEAESRVRRLVESSRLAVGPWYVLADEVLSSGEALISNLRIGLDAARRFGGRLDVGYSPDAFGHPEILPVLLRGFGIETAVVWRGVPAGVHDRFRWRGPDGSDVFVWRLPPRGYESGASTGELVSRAKGAIVPVFVGRDHAAPDPHIVAQLGDVPIERLDNVMREMSGEHVETRTGELRSIGDQWLLTGTLSARIPLKLRVWEGGQYLERVTDPLVALMGNPESIASRDAVWRWHLQNHFHDTLCGTIADDVEREAMVRARNVRAAAQDLATTAWDCLVQHDAAAARGTPRDSWRPAVTLWNPSPYSRREVVVLDLPFFSHDVRVGPRAPAIDAKGQGPVDVVLETGDGSRVAGQVIDRRLSIERLETPFDYPDQDGVHRLRVAIMSPDVPGLGFRVMRVAESDEPEQIGHGDVRVESQRIENDLVRVDVARDGTATITDRRSGVTTARLGQLVHASDHGDLYTSAPGREERLGEDLSLAVVQRGPLLGSIVGRGSTYSVCWELRAESPVARLTVRYDNEQPNTRLRVLFPSGAEQSTVWTGGHFGPSARGMPVHDVSETTGEHSPRTFPCRRLVSAARGGKGLSVFTGGLSECAWDDDGSIAITLLRSCGELSRNDVPDRPGHVAWMCETPGAQYLDTHEWTLGCMLHGADALEDYADVMRAADAFDTPLQSRAIRNAGALEEPDIGITLEGKGLVFSSCQPSRDGGVILRCFNASTDEVRGAWRLIQPASEAHVVRMDETRLAQLELEDAGRTMRFDATPRAVITVKLVWVG